MRIFGLSLVLALSVICLPQASKADDTTDNQICRWEMTGWLEENCCGDLDDKATKKRKCLTNFSKTAKLLKPYLSTALLKIVRSDAAALRKSPVCENVVHTDENPCTAVSKILTKITKSCCTKKFKIKRQSCLKDARKAFNSIKKYLDDENYKLIRDKINNKFKAKKCGQGGLNNPTGCEVYRSVGGGFLHKYPSDHGNVVLLLPPYDSASACDYVAPNGEVLIPLHYVYRANGNRQHWRPYSYSVGFCSSFKGNRPVYARCTIRGQKHCWTVPDPCRRYE